jgi:magnesium-protoporphyrin IX monomethyl ester (oxidative) cyclase
MSATTQGSTEYDFTVFRITSEICRQVFPLSLDLDHPAFLAGLERLRRIAGAIDAARARGGVVGRLKRIALTAAAAVGFARLFCLPAKRNEMPARIRLAPAW